MSSLPQPSNSRAQVAVTAAAAMVLLFLAARRLGWSGAIWLDLFKAVLTPSLTAMGLVVAAHIAFRRESVRRMSERRLAQQEDAIAEYQRTLAAVWHTTTDSIGGTAVAIRGVQAKVTLAFGDENLGNEVRDYLRECLRLKLDHAVFDNEDSIEADGARLTGLLLQAIARTHREVGLPPLLVTERALTASKDKPRFG